MVNDYPTDDGADGVLPLSCNDHDPHFSFTSCPHSCSHGFICNTNSEPHEKTNNSVYPSPPPTNSQQKRNVPLPGAMQQQYQFGGILDSPVVHMSAPPVAGLFSPPPTIPTSTHALPDDEPVAFSSKTTLLQPIAEDETPSQPQPQPQLLSPISPEWTTSCKPEELFATGDTGDSVLMAQDPDGAHDYYTEKDVLGGAMPFGRPALHHLDIPSYHDHATPQSDMHADQPVLLGFSGTSMPHLIEEEGQDVTSSFGYTPPSPSSPFRDLKPSDLDDLDMDYQPFYASPSLRSFASLPSPDLDDLELDMDIGPGMGMSPSPSRRCVASLPSFDDEDIDFSNFAYDTSLEPIDFDMSSPSASSSSSFSPQTSPLPSPHFNALLLDLPAPDATAIQSSKTPSVLDTLSTAELAALLPAGYPPAELDGLLGVRERAGEALAAALSSSPSSPTLGQDTPRDAGEPRRRRKRAKELTREVDALVGLVLGLLPTPTAAAVDSAPVEAVAAPGYFDDEHPNKKAAKAKAKMKARGEKTGLVGSASVPQLVARMILRRRDRGARVLAEAPKKDRVGSPLGRCCFSLEGDEPPPSGGAMDVDGDVEADISVE
ncbi:hypothetical protein C8J57DRAFT_1705682 [Mycena rebaudengoi]|nr:hypothetical protein C8J57DRAFT_1705682 [Mycena rebaudengoi]